MGFLPDRFLEYIATGAGEELVTRERIAPHERAIVLGTLGATQLLAEGSPLPDRIVVRMRKLLSALGHPEPGVHRVAMLRSPATGRARERVVDVQFDALALPESDAIETVLARHFNATLGSDRTQADLPAVGQERELNLDGLRVILRRLDGDPTGSAILELALADNRDTKPQHATALLWTAERDPDVQHTAFDPAGIARLRWPTAPRNTLRIDAGPHIGLIDLHTAA